MVGLSSIRGGLIINKLTFETKIFRGRFATVFSF